MTEKHTIENSIGLRMARQISASKGSDWAGIFEKMKRERALSTAVREMNELMDHPVHGSTIRAAFVRMGLDNSI